MSNDKKAYLCEHLDTLIELVRLSENIPKINVNDIMKLELFDLEEYQHKKTVLENKISLIKSEIFDMITEITSKKGK